MSNRELLVMAQEDRSSDPGAFRHPDEIRAGLIFRDGIGNASSSHLLAEQARAYDEFLGHVMHSGLAVRTGRPGRNLVKSPSDNIPHQSMGVKQGSAY